LSKRKWIVSSAILLSFMLTFISYAGELYSQSNNQFSAIEKVKIPQTKLQNLKPGTNVKLTFKSDNTFKGRYCGMEIMEAVTYEIIYIEFCHKKISDPMMPRPGENVTVKMKSGQMLPAVFNGFDYRRISITKLQDTLPQWIMLPEVEAIHYKKDTYVTGDILDNMTIMGELPLLSAIAIEDGRFRNLVALHEIKNIEVRPGKN